jgi:hypothetical protein
MYPCYHLVFVCVIDRSVCYKQASMGAIWVLHEVMLLMV